MKTFFKVVGIALLVVVALIAGAVSWLSLKKPAQRPPSAEKIDATPERLARGKYVVEHVSECLRMPLRPRHHVRLRREAGN